MSGLASQLPDPGRPEFPAIVGALAAFVATAVVVRRTGDWELAQDQAFRFGFLGTAIGLVVYLLDLTSDLY